MKPPLLFPPLSWLLFLLAQIPLPTRAQTLSWAHTVNDQDSGPLTAAAMDDAGNLYLASLVQTKPFLGKQAIFGQYHVGDLVLTKWSAAGELLWRREFPDNKVRVMAMVVGPDQSLILTGGYVDTFFIGPGWFEPGVVDNSSFFLAKTDLDGNFQWVRTDVSDLVEDRLGVTVALSNQRIYVSGYHDGIETRLAKYDLHGTVLAAKVLNIRTLSDLAVGGTGELYAAGTASSFASFDTLDLPPTDFLSGYDNYVVRLDTHLNAQWGATSSYVTFDDHPRVEWFDGRVMVLTHDFYSNTFGSGAHHLRAYEPDGSLAWTDTIPDGPEILDPYNFGLKTACDRLWLQYPKVAGLALRTYDAALVSDETFFAAQGDFSGSFPVLPTGGDRLVWASNFRSGTLTINDTLLLQNPAAPASRQVLASFQCEATSAVAGPATANSGWVVYPNPASTDLYLKRTGQGTARSVSAALLDAQGRVRMNFPVAGENPLVLPVAGLASGNYWLRITEDGRVRILPFMVL